MKEVIIAGAFTLIGALLGFVGTLIQGLISAKKDKQIVALQSKAEINRLRYFEKEKLYSDIIGFVPAMVLAIDYRSNKINLSKEQRVLLNSFKARLLIYSSKAVSDEFYDLLDKICSASDEKETINIINNFTDKLVNELQQEVSTNG